MRGAASADLLQLRELLASRDPQRTAAGFLELQEKAAQDAGRLSEIGLALTGLRRHEQAYPFYRQASTLRPEEPAFRYNLATGLIALGRLDEAEEQLDDVIRRAPQDYDAWYNRSTLRLQREDRNHVAALEAQLSRCGDNPAAVAPLAYALAKELEDLGDFERSLALLQQGAQARRSLLDYRVESDEQALAQLTLTFDAAYLGRPPAGFDDERPLFVLGLPRSGTTLVDRILSSHPDVASTGESADLALAVTRHTPAARDKFERIRAARDIDAVALGRCYAEGLPAGDAQRVVDKTPMNYLYVALIRASLPRAHVVHVEREPMDVCFAMYKTLFRSAYPFSYDLDDLGRYFIAYHRLLSHWHATVREGLHRLSYESLVDRQEACSRRLLADVGLAWHPDCLAFDRNSKPILTASSAQVRRPMYRSSIGAWRRHARFLEPLRERLQKAGIACDAPAVEHRADEGS